MKEVLNDLVTRINISSTGAIGKTLGDVDADTIATFAGALRNASTEQIGSDISRTASKANTGPLSNGVLLPPIVQKPEKEELPSPFTVLNTIAETQRKRKEGIYQQLLTISSNQKDDNNEKANGLGSADLLKLQATVGSMSLSITLFSKVITSVTNAINTLAKTQ